VQGRVDEAAAAMGGELISGRPETVWRGASLDSRAIRDGELFFALPGERSDGHLYVGAALERGACAVVVQREVETPGDAGVIRVPDTFEALHLLTREARRRTPGHLVAVTGSVGKTTTKELLAAILSRRFKVARNPGNLNNLFGFPIALLGIPDDTEWMVAEMGMSTPGELGRISRLGRPDVAVLINVKPVHMEFFGSLRAIAEAKAEILEGLAPGGVLVANRDDPEVTRIARGFEGKVIWFGIDYLAEVRAEEIESGAPAEGTRFVLTLGAERGEIHLPLYGRYNVENCLAAAACASHLGLGLEEIQAGLKTVGSLARRGIVHRLPGDRVVIDDTYNSNPVALSRALESARALPAKRHWAVLGDMLELGEGAPDYHRAAGREAAELGFGPVVGVGELAREIASGAGEADAEGLWFEDALAAATALRGRLEPGDVVLVKGSRGVALESVVDSLLAEVEGAD
jgi:UDP-N-acetylmuramoyl-tripeptide--D-alanyl-D-alanine ligase